MQDTSTHSAAPIRSTCSKKTVAGRRDGLAPGDAFYYADGFNLSWLPTLQAVWSPIGQQVMIPTPRHVRKRYGIGAVNYHAG